MLNNLIIQEEEESFDMLTVDLKQKYLRRRTLYRCIKPTFPRAQLSSLITLVLPTECKMLRTVQRDVNQLNGIGWDAVDRHS